MLHGVGDVCGLDDMLDDDGRLQVGRLLLRERQRLGVLVEGLVPTRVTQRLRLFVEDIRCHHAVHHELAESLEFILVREDALLEVAVFRLHQGIPSNIDRILLGKTAVLVLVGHVRLLHGELHVRNTVVLNVMDQCAEEDRELRQRIRCDTVGVVVQIGCDGLGGLALVVHVLGDDDSVEQLACGHRHVGGVLEVVEWIVVVHQCQHGDEVAQLLDDLVGQ
mmetsp:Transcript_23157/g.64618  ORF Transcript_23157/g.64618 Transcript_23157/m.64618 type:complete len:221 (-) Transcript_23157:984-1646(-)